MTDAANRRQSVRVTDRVLLTVNPIPPEKAKRIGDDFHQGISLYNQEGLTDIQMFVSAQGALLRLREKDEDLADFLQHLDSKVNMILQKVKSEKSLLDTLAMRKANLSGNGIAFYQNSPRPLHEAVEVHVVMLPAYIYIYAIGTVIACEENHGEDEEKFRIAVEFTLLAEEDREKIIQHNFKQQSLALRNRRLGVHE